MVRMTPWAQKELSALVLWLVFVRWLIVPVLLMVVLVLLALTGCVATSGGYRAEIYSDPAGSVPARAHPLMWIFFHNNRTAEMYDAARAVQGALDSCGFRVAGVAFADSGVRTSPPHQFRLDVAVAEEPSWYQDRLGAYHEYVTVRVETRIVRAADQTLIAEDIGYGNYSADGRSSSPVRAGVRIRASRQAALQAATEGAVRSVCRAGRSGYYYDAPSASYPYAAPYGRTLCGYGASGRMTKKGAWDMRYDCRRW